MTKHLCDLILLDRNPELASVQAALRLPADNHAVVAPSEFLGSVDRFVFGKSESAALYDDWNALDKDSQVAILKSYRPILPDFFVEWHEGESTIGAWVDGKSVSIYLRGKGRVFFVMNFVIEDLSSSRADVTYKTSIGRDGADHFCRAFHLIVAALGSNRVTTITRQNPRLDTRADRRRAQKIRQRCGALFSKNIVTLNRPQTALHRGELKPVESFAGMRGHFVIGHWRLIDNELQPYWTWVDGHERGDRDLGWVLKERHFKPTKDIRKGFFVPDVIGHPGQRLDAEKAA